MPSTGKCSRASETKKKRQTENTESIVFNGNIAFDWSNASRPQSRKRNKLSNERHLKFDEIFSPPLANNIPCVCWRIPAFSWPFFLLFQTNVCVCRKERVCECVKISQSFLWMVFERNKSPPMSNSTAETTHAATYLYLRWHTDTHKQKGGFFFRGSCIFYGLSNIGTCSG